MGIIHQDFKDFLKLLSKNGVKYLLIGGYEHCTIAVIDDVEVTLISLKDLKKNKKASGRYKDLNDLEHL